MNDRRLFFVLAWGDKTKQNRPVRNVNAGRPAGRVAVSSAKCEVLKCEAICRLDGVHIPVKEGGPEVTKGVQNSNLTKNSRH